MKIIWKKSDQHSDWGLLRVGDAIDTTALKIPDEVVSSWTSDGFAEVIPEPKPESERPDKPKKVKSAKKEA
jgi:hypothetical protein